MDTQDTTTDVRPDRFGTDDDAAFVVVDLPAPADDRSALEAKEVKVRVYGKKSSPTGNAEQPRDEMGRFTKARGITSPTIRPPVIDPEASELANSPYKRFVVGRKAAAKYGVTEDVSVDDLVATQDYINPDKLVELLGKIPDTLQTDEEMPIVIRQGGIQYVGDGHHRVEVLKLRGLSRFKARVIDVDDHGRPTLGV